VKKDIGLRDVVSFSFGKTCCLLLQSRRVTQNMEVAALLSSGCLMCTKLQRALMFVATNTRTLGLWNMALENNLRFEKVA
jgi:hypothetical protein